MTRTSGGGGRGGGGRAPAILLVEDDDDQRLMLAELLTHCGYEVTAAAGADAALRSAAVRFPGVAIIDIGLPRVDGLRLAVLLRSLAAARSLLMVAVTGYALSPTDVEAAGYDHYLLKPVRMDALLAVLPAPPVEFTGSLANAERR